MKMIRHILIIPFLLMLTSSALHAMSYEDERKISKEFITFLNSQNLIIYDHEITWTLQMLTDRLADHIDSPIYPFKIHAVRDYSVNAFAIPDGHIFINLGTILFVEDLDELAGVIAHEMGHGQLRHIARYFETQKKISAASIAGIIAGTLLSAANPEIGAALVYSSMGGGENIKLAYSRQNEYQADEFGSNLLKTSGFDPSAMMRFLIRLQTFSGGSSMPEYFLTHPYTRNRIASVSTQSDEPRPDANYWTLYASTVGLMLSGKEVQIRSKSIPEPYRSLALGISKTLTKEHEEALALLDGIDLSRAYEYKGINLFLAGRKGESYPYLKDYGRSAQAKIALSEIMEERGELNPAIAAILPYQKQEALADYRLGTLYEKVSKSALSHVSFARYFFKTQKIKACIYHTEKALELKRELDKDTIEEMEEMKKLLRNRTPS